MDKKYYFLILLVMFLSVFGCLGMFGIGGPELASVLVLILVLIIVVIPFRKIFAKAGYSGWWSLLFILPVVSIIALYVFAFREWPIQRKPEELKNKAGV